MGKSFVKVLTLRWSEASPEFFLEFVPWKHMSFIPKHPANPLPPLVSLSFQVVCCHGNLLGFHRALIFEKTDAHDWTIWLGHPLQIVGIIALPFWRRRSANPHRCLDGCRGWESLDWRSTQLKVDWVFPPFATVFPELHQVQTPSAQYAPC